MYGKIKMKLINVIDQLKRKGFFGIVFSSTLVKIVSLTSAIFLPRVIASKYEYGVLTDIDNLRSYFLLINAFGISNATLRFCVLDGKMTESKSKGNFIFTLLYGSIISIFLFLIYIIFCWNYGFNFKGERNLMALMSFMPFLMFLLEDFQLYLRSGFHNKKYSLSAVIYAGTMFSLQIVFGWFSGLKGVIWGRYAAIIFSLAFTAYLTVRSGKFYKNFSLPDKSVRKSIVSFGLITMIANASSLIMQLNEKRIISDTLLDAQYLADYQVSTYVLSLTGFVINAIIIFVLPYFVRHREDKKWIYNFYSKIMKLNAIVMVPLHLILFIWAKEFLMIIFGTQYGDAYPVMRMILLASLSQTIFRNLPGNILPAIGFEKYNLVVNIVCVVIHFVIAKISITHWGITGAALALTTAYFISGLAYMIKLRNYCKSE